MCPSPGPLAPPPLPSLLNVRGRGGSAPKSDPGTPGTEEPQCALCCLHRGLGQGPQDGVGTAREEAVDSSAPSSRVLFQPGHGMRTRLSAPETAARRLLLDLQKTLLLVCWVPGQPSPGLHAAPGVGAALPLPGLLGTPLPGPNPTAHCFPQVPLTETV